MTPAPDAPRDAARDAPRARLQAMLTATGLSGRRFAQAVLAGRDERSLRRWLAEGEIPARVSEWMDGVELLRIDKAGKTVTLRVRI